MEWYTQVDGTTPISQGDIIFDCPILLPSTEINLTHLENLNNIQMAIYTADVIIMTQACDLANNPPETVVVARIDDLEGKSWQTISEINSGRRPAYHLISNKSKKDEGDIIMDYRIVDFTSIYSISLKLLQEYVKLQGTRLRLNSPYLEFMAQRFGYYFSRIGLPIDISKEDLKNCWEKLNPR